MDGFVVQITVQTVQLDFLAGARNGTPEGDWMRLFSLSGIE